MFNIFKNKKKIEELKDEVRKLNTCLEYRDNWLKDKDKEIEKLKLLNTEQLEEITIDSDVYFDFTKVNVFSIERMCDNRTNGKINTIIGFLLPKGEGKYETKEWFLYCSQEQHDKLVKQFSQHKV